MGNVMDTFITFLIWQVDEAHRLKNIESAIAADIRLLRFEHMHMLTGTTLCQTPRSRFTYDLGGFDL